MAHGNRKKKALDGFRRSKCSERAEIRSDLEAVVKSLIGSGAPVLTICRQVEEVREEFRNELRGRA
jgi:hypothetical protein